MNEAWRLACEADLDGIDRIADIVHPTLPESRAVLLDKVMHCPEGCLVLAGPEGVWGYALSHPWVIGQVPKLDRLLGYPPGPCDCLYIHDVALLPVARGRGALSAFVRRARGLAVAMGLPRLALVSVYGTVPIWQRFGFLEQQTADILPQLAPYGGDARYMVAELCDPNVS